MSNPAYTNPADADGGTQLRSSNDRLGQVDTGVGQTPVLHIGDKVRHRLGGQTGQVVDLHADPFVKEITHGIVNWTGDGDGFGQGYSSTSLKKF